MTITVVGAKTNAGSGNDPSITHGLTILEDDVIIALVNNNAIGNTVSSNTPGSEFTVLFNSDGSNGNTHSYGILIQRAGASVPASLGAGLLSAVSWGMGGVVLRGVPVGAEIDVSPIEGNEGGGSSTQASFPSISTLTDNAYVLGMAVSDSSNVVFQTPTNGFTILDQIASGRSLAIIGKSQAAAGDVGATTLGLTATNDWTTMLISITGDAVTPDTTAPVNDVAPASTNQTQNGHDITATLDEAGTIYAVRLADGAAAPSSAQVKLGQDSTGSAAPEAKSVAAAAATQASMTFSTGAASTAYDYYVVAEDDESTPNLQTSPVLVNATTAAPTLSIASATDIKLGETFTITTNIRSTSTTVFISTRYSL